MKKLIFCTICMFLVVDMAIAQWGWGHGFGYGMGFGNGINFNLQTRNVGLNINAGNIPFNGGFFAQPFYPYAGYSNNPVIIQNVQPNNFSCTQQRRQCTNYEGCSCNPRCMPAPKRCCNQIRCSHRTTTVITTTTEYKYIYRYP